MSEVVNGNRMNNWKYVRFGDYAKTEKGRKPKAISNEKTDKYSIPYINIKAFEKNIIDEYTDGVGCILCEDDDFLMVWDGSRSGYVGKAIEGALGSTLVRIKLPGVNHNFAYYFLQSKYLEINSRAKGVGIPHVDPNIVWNYKFPLPPVEDQEQTVSKIEELFSEIDKGIEEIKTAQQQLKVYRQAVLKWAFEGKLTNKYVKEGELPKGWVLRQVNDFKTSEAGAIGAGPFGTIFKAKDFRSSGIPIIFLRHVKAGSYNSRKPGFMDKEVWEALFQTYSVFGGELLITKLGEPPGECAIYPCGQGPAMVTPDVIKMQVNTELVEPKYLMHYFNSENSKKALEEIAFGTTRLRITLPIFKALPIPYCSLQEQQQMVQEIESRLSVCDKIEETITNSLKQAEALRQSILKKAFEGRLV
jgi:type I restriction enzyme, S subunit